MSHYRNYSWCWLKQLTIIIYNINNLEWIMFSFLLSSVPTICISLLCWYVLATTLFFVSEISYFWHYFSAFRAECWNWTTGSLHDVFQAHIKFLCCYIEKLWKQGQRKERAGRVHFELKAISCLVFTIISIFIDFCVSKNGDLNVCSRFFQEWTVFMLTRNAMAKFLSSSP